MTKLSSWVGVFFSACVIAACSSSESSPAPASGGTGGGTDAAPDQQTADSAAPDQEASTESGAQEDAPAEAQNDAPASDAACSITAQDCPQGDKCTPLFSATSVAPTCMDDGTAPLGEGCTVNGSFGDDDCASGGFCSAHGYPNGTPQVRTCHKLCDQAAQCSATEKCLRLSGQPGFPFGVCSKACDPFASDCAAGTGCVRNPSVDQGPQFFCLKGKTTGGQAGAACTSVIDCSEGLSCSSPDMGDGFCGVACDATHTCSAGTCDTTGGQTIGVCIP